MTRTKSTIRRACLAYILAARQALKERRQYWLVPAGFWGQNHSSN